MVPPGPGKTTILRSIAGIVEPDAGRIALGDLVYFDSLTGTNLPIQHRRVGFVFQDYLLFPHLTAVQNVSYAISAASSKERRARTLELLGIAFASDRRPRELSGGEQQRVTLARALGSDPAILLLDEPMSALDTVTRLRLLGGIVELHRRLAIPFLYVTHSPADAVRVGDIALVINAGSVVQEGKPVEVFNAPRDLEVSQAVGSENILPGRIQDHQEREGSNYPPAEPGISQLISVIDLGACQLATPYNALPKDSEVAIGIRSDDIIVSRERIGKTSARNLLQGPIKRVVHHGPEVGIPAETPA